MKAKISLITVFTCLFMALQAQTPAQINIIKKAIKEDFVIKVAALTEKKGCVIIGKTNGYRQKGLSEALTKKLKQLKDDEYTIDHVFISPKGMWSIIYNKNRNVVYSKGVPEEMKADLKDMKKNGYTYTWIAFNDNGEFVCKGYDAKNKKNKWKVSPLYLKTNSSGNSIGAFTRAVCMTNKGGVLIYENNNVEYIGTVPANVKNAIKKYMKTSSNPDGFVINNISYTDSGNVVISDGKGLTYIKSVD